MWYTQEKLSSGNPLMKSEAAVLELKMGNKMKFDLHRSFNELLFDTRLDLTAGRATLHAACGRTFNGGEEHPQWYGGFLRIEAIVEGRKVSAVCVMQAAGGLKLSMEHDSGALECCVMVADVEEEHEYMEVDVAVDEDVEMDVDIEMGDATEGGEDIEMDVEVV